MKIKTALIDFVETVIVSGVVILTIYSFVGSVESISGPSMEPTFYTNQRILVDKIFRKFDRGNIVVLYPPGMERKHFIKRIVGMPGDIFKIYNCNLYVAKDNLRFILQENYLAESSCTYGNMGVREGRAMRIPEGYYLVMGDNRGNSVDSRVFGLVDEKLILGRVVFRFWPLTKFGFVL
ncbi:signal peptidase I [candidate division WWE3 bacterium RIFOXYC1_FULL_40_10]|nr:MAG: signal peptidase I [candidate division WWE3 bacterium RIFOXYB1_FULL_40_22]OGC61876.1 MAG: signal peptidase I [candidate division WWE3 bacterium RIFOXYA1_FULL_40_11]OGC66259.1 MAG: signal peptidase I [candidate division WWE3 bacterium RIFOXYC1_FULL_40_10]OGC67864.1 MAG: signal peptidase I [candidate division WWE3 bacterium RIFOXYC2_FULL_40_11]OGC70529.1 MAG: signal peptidase I [candidate division WWE3 bacterium RIFOXYD1_FULL_40_11]HLD50806.1 signal peptidase I [Patescibacteria group bac